MAISDEITRLQSAKAALKTAINAKNDSSHQIDDETLEDYAGFVDLIHDALPAAYTELEYIESSGTQYIDTGIDSIVNLKTEIVAQQTSIVSGFPTIVGAIESSSAYKVIFGYGSNGFYTQSGNVTSGYKYFNSADTAKHIITVDNGTDSQNIQIDNYTSTSSYAITTGTSVSVALFARKSYTGTTVNFASMKLWSAKFWREGTIIRNLIPAKRNSDNAIGMYDKVSGTFFTNAGTGEFIAPEGSGGSSATLVTKSITANGTYNAEDDSADGYSEVTVNVQPPQEAQSKDVNFYDYDGKILYSYTASEFAQLTALPANPTHTGLTSQGWNWTLADAKAQVTAVGACDIGQMYATTDGKTRLYCHFPEELKSFYFGLEVNGTVVIDWGDNTTDTVTGTSRSTVVNTQHTYSIGGDYVITLEVTSGNFGFYSTSSSYTLFRKDITDRTTTNRAYLACLRKVEIGENAWLNQYAFCCCVNLKTITLPKTLPVFAVSVFWYCYSLKHLTIPKADTPKFSKIDTNSIRQCFSLKSVSLPNSITSFGTYVFYYDYSLTRIVLPPSLSSCSTGCFVVCSSLKEAYLPTNLVYASQQLFDSCYALVSLTFPATVIQVYTKAFNSCYGMKEYHFKSTTVPTLDNADAFSNIQSDCVIYVPSAKLNDYKTASNWSTYASQMVGE